MSELDSVIHQPTRLWIILQQQPTRKMPPVRKAESSECDE